MRAFCTAGRLVVAAVSFLALSSVACSGQNPAGDTTSGARGASAAPDLRRFEVLVLPVRRGPGHLLRSDTATGQTWIMGTTQEPKWQAMREGPEGVPTPDGTVAGRYEIQSIQLTRGAPTLVRLDRHTGQIWRKGATSLGPWVPVPNPDTSVTEPDPDWEPLPEPMVNQIPLPNVPNPVQKAAPAAKPKP